MYCAEDKIGPFAYFFHNNEEVSATVAGDHYRAIIIETYKFMHTHP